MASYVSYGTAQGGVVDWGAPTTWQYGVVPNRPDTDVVLTTPYPYYDSYPVTVIDIGAASSFSINSLSVDGAEQLRIEGSLAVAGAANEGYQYGVGLDSTPIFLNGGMLTTGSLNLDATLAGIGQVTVSDLFSAQASARVIANGGTLTLKAGSFAGFRNGRYTDNTATQNGGVLNIGLSGVIVDDGGSITLGGPGSVNTIDPTTGTLVNVLSTLQVVDGGLTLNGAQTFTAAQALTIAGALILNGGTLSTPALTVVSDGKASGSGAINGPIVDNGSITVTGNLVLSGPVTGTGRLLIQTQAGSGQELELSGPDSAAVVFGSAPGTVQFDDPAEFTGTITVGPVAAVSSASNSSPTPVYADQILLQGIALSSVTATIYTPTSSGGILMIQEGVTTQTFNFTNSNLTVGSFALANGPSGSQPSLSITATPLPSAPTIGLAGTSSPRAIIANGSFGVSGTDTPGSSLIISANGTAASSVTYGNNGDVNQYAAVVAPDLVLGVQTVSLSATASNAAGSVAGSASVSVDLLPSPVNNVTTSDDSSFDLAQLLGRGYSFSFLSSTQAIALTNGTLSVGTDTTQAVVQRLYRGLLLRSADAGGLVNFSQQLANGTSVVNIANGLLSSSEYAARNGTPDNAAFVTQLYQSILGRTPSATDLSGYVDTLNGGQSRGLVASIFATSAEAKVHLAAFTADLWAPDANGSLVVQLYQTALAREPGQAETQGWVRQIQAGLSPQDFAQDIAASAEFGRDHNGQSPPAFVTSLYQAGLGRMPGPGEVSGWVNQINAGAPPATILLGIGNSAEAIGRLSPYI